MDQIPNHLKRLVREWAGIAHDRELSTALSELRAHFERWERAEITAADEVPPELLQHVASWVQFYEAEQSTS